MPRGLSCLSAPMHPFVDDTIGGIGLPRFPAIVLGQEHLFDELIEFVQVIFVKMGLTLLPCGVPLSVV